MEEKSGMGDDRSRRASVTPPVKVVAKTQQIY